MRDDDGDLLLAELLERSFGPGPDGLPTPAERLVAGQRALRRRQQVGIAGATLAAAAAVALGMTLSGVVRGASGADDPTTPVATSGATVAPSASASVTPSSTEQQAALDRLERKARQRAHLVEQQLVSAQFPASFAPDGEVVVKDGWRITQRVDEPMGYQPPEASLGVVVTDGAQTRWMLLMLNRETDGHGNPIDALGPSASADDPGKAYSRFEDWLASTVDLQGGDSAPPLITVDGDDRLRPGPGAVLVETRPAPVIDGYTTDGDRMAEVRREGRTWFAVVRGHGPRADVIPVDAAALAAPTFEAFVDHLASQAASGEGLR